MLASEKGLVATFEMMDKEIGDFVGQKLLVPDSGIPCQYRMHDGSSI